MATCRDVIYRAYRLSGIVGVSDDPTAEEAVFGMGALQSLFDDWVVSGMFGRLTDKLVTDDHTALEQQRVVVASGSPTITIPDTYSFCGEVGSDRTPYDLSLIEVQNGATRNVWIYDRGWADIAALAIGDACPLSNRGINGLAGVLARSAMGPFTAEVSPFVAREAMRFLGQLSYKSGSERPARADVYF